MDNKDVKTTEPKYVIPRRNDCKYYQVTYSCIWTPVSNYDELIARKTGAIVISSAATAILYRLNAIGVDIKGTSVQQETHKPAKRKNESEDDDFWTLIIRHKKLPLPCGDDMFPDAPEKNCILLLGEYFITLLEGHIGKDIWATLKYSLRITLEPIEDGKLQDVPAHQITLPIGKYPSVLKKITMENKKRLDRLAKQKNKETSSTIKQ
jgi:hypothetical protein